MDPSMKMLLFFLICQAIQASDLCLMLNPEEEAALTHAEEQARKGGAQSKNPHALRLDGIIYSHPKSWRPVIQWIPFAFSMLLRNLLRGYGRQV